MISIMRLYRVYIEYKQHDVLGRHVETQWVKRRLLADGLMYRYNFLSSSVNVVVISALTGQRAVYALFAFNAN